jgi:hypothetical protein
LKKVILVALFGAALIGCSKEEEVRLVDYYLEHEQEREEKLAWCKQSADRRQTVNCQNALSAHSKATMEKIFTEGY